MKRIHCKRKLYKCFVTYLKRSEVATNLLPESTVLIKLHKSFIKIHSNTLKNRRDLSNELAKEGSSKSTRWTVRVLFQHTNRKILQKTRISGVEPRSSGGNQHKSKLMVLNKSFLYIQQMLPPSDLFLLKKEKNKTGRGGRQMIFLGTSTPFRVGGEV